MTEVPVPFTGEEVDTSDGASSVAMSIGVLIAGFGLFELARSTGGTVAQMATNKISQVTGYDPTTGQSSGADVL